MAYVGSSTCAWSNQPTLPQAVEEIRARLASLARQFGASFKAEGVALEWSVERGVEHLSRFGPFDEVSVGYNWGNTFALGNLWNETSHAPLTPSILLFRRHFVAPEHDDDELHYEERDRETVLVLRGLHQILEFAASDGWVPGFGDPWTALTSVDGSPFQH